LPLEQALALFEEGVQISKFCNSKLDAAERRVEILLKNERGELEPVDFAGEDQEQE
jgi:exodeoxyribonuclease VII small subunit